MNTIATNLQRCRSFKCPDPQHRSTESESVDSQMRNYDAPTIAVLRRALDEIVRDQRFLSRKSATALEMAEHLLKQAAAGERDLARL
jgi:hypothetical protein